MPYMPSAFARSLEPLDRRVTARLVAAHGGDRGVGSRPTAWTCERHLKALLFAQLAGSEEPARDRRRAGRAERCRFITSICARRARSTLADANAARPAAVFRDIAAGAGRGGGGRSARRGRALIRLIDSTPIPLKDDALRLGRGECSHARAETASALRSAAAPAGMVRGDLGQDSTTSVAGPRRRRSKAGATYVMDKGYTDYRWWSEIIAAGAFFVTRRKRNAHRREIVEPPAARRRHPRRPPPQDRPSPAARRRAPLNPLYETELREVVVARPDHDQPLVSADQRFEPPGERDRRSSTRSAGRSSCCSSGSSRTSRSAASGAAAKTPCASRSMSR